MRTKKKYLLIALIIIICIVLIICKIMIKNNKFGNNINSQEIVDYILNINSYKSNIKVQVNSNKNKNIYILEQEYSTENGCIQVVKEPANISGVKIIFKDGNLKIENTSLSLSRIFENYKGIEENCLDLICFIDDFKNSDKSRFDENESELILKTKSRNDNKYINNKILYINKENKKPTKLIIEDDNQNTTINIEYNSIDIN